MATDRSEKLKIFITGATGYIAGSIIHLMLSRAYLARFDITVLVRRRTDAEAMRALGIIAVLGSLDDTDLISREAAAADVVLNNANCDHQPSAAAIVRGLSYRAASTGTKPILIHTSGAGVLSTNSRGEGLLPANDPTAAVWDEVDAEAHAAIPAFAPHRLVDLEVFAGAASGLINTYLMVPPTVFGVGLGQFAERRMSIQIPRLVHYSVLYKRAQYVGSGENVWANVHVADLAELYLLLLDAALTDTAPKGRHGLYYPVTEHFEWRIVAHRIGEELYRRGMVASPEARTGLQPGWFWGSNVRLIPTNSHALGWAPSHGGTERMLIDITHDFELVLDAMRPH